MPFRFVVAPFGPKTPKWTGATTSLGFLGLSYQSISGFFGRLRPENPKTNWEDEPGLPRLVMPVCFGVFYSLSGQKIPKRIGMTSLGFPGLSCRSVSGILRPFRPENPETCWDDKPGLPKLVIPLHFVVFLHFRPENHKTVWNDKPGLTRLVIAVRFGICLSLYGQSRSQD